MPHDELNEEKSYTYYVECNRNDWDQRVEEENGDKGHPQGLLEGVENRHHREHL